MDKLFLSLALFMLVSVGVWASYDCFTCGLSFHEEDQLVNHLIVHHHLEHKESLFQKAPNRDMNPELALWILSELDVGRGVKLDLDERNLEYILDFKKQEIILLNHFAVNKKYTNCGSALLMIAVSQRQYEQIEVLFENSDDLASLDVVDQRGKNAFERAREVRDSYEFESSEYKIWQNIVDQLSLVFRVAKFSGFFVRDTPAVDFCWRKANEVGKIIAAKKIDTIKDDISIFKQKEKPFWWGRCFTKYELVQLFPQ